MPVGSSIKTKRINLTSANDWRIETSQSDSINDSDSNEKGKDTIFLSKI